MRPPTHLEQPGRAEVTTRASQRAFVAAKFGSLNVRHGATSRHGQHVRFENSRAASQSSPASKVPSGPVPRAPRPVMAADRSASSAHAPEANFDRLGIEFDISILDILTTAHVHGCGQRRSHERMTMRLYWRINRS